MHAGQILSPTDTLTHMHTEHGELQCGDGGRPAGVVLCVSAARDLRVQETAQWRVARVSSSDHPCRMHKYLVHIPDHSTARNSCRKQEAHERDGDGVAIHEH